MSNGSVSLVRHDGDDHIGHRWDIPNFRSHIEEFYSPTFTGVGTLWRLLLFPSGNGSNALSVYLDATRAESKESKHWEVNTHFMITVVNTNTASRSVKQETDRVFHSNSRDWGFQEFMPLSELYDPKLGFLTSNTLIIEVDIRVVKQVNKESNFHPTRRKTVLGLVNLGATCYLNSLLQTLFHLRYFRRAIYNMPIPEASRTIPREESERLEAPERPSLTFALQRLFHSLQYGTEPGNPSELVFSFGWTERDMFQQHDVQEMCRMLLDKISTAMRNTPSSGIVDMLFKGTILHTVECVNVDYRSALEEDFYDIQLNVKGCKNIYDSLKEYTAVEMLDGPNKYHADSYGFQTARKAAAFKTLPNVLVFHLKRFEFDATTESLRKVNSYYEFYPSIHLDQYIASNHNGVAKSKYRTQDDEGDEKNEFILHSVLVHSGSMSSGHYVAFCCPDGQTWHKFDDRTVTEASSHDAITVNFGKSSSKQADCNGNAYLLVYVRKTSWNILQKDLKETDCPSSLRYGIERSVQPSICLDTSEPGIEINPMCHVRVLTVQNLSKDPTSEVFFSEGDVMPLKVPRTMPFEQFCERVAANYFVSTDLQLYWLFEDRLNGQQRPSQRVVPTPGATVETVFRMDRMAFFSTNVVVFLLEASPSQRFSVKGLEGTLHSSERKSVSSSILLELRDQVLVFFKVFRRDSYIHTFCRLCGNTIPFLSLMSDPANPLGLLDMPEVYEEVRPSIMERIDTSLSLGQLGITDGDALLLYSVHGLLNPNDRLLDSAPLNWTITNEDDVMCTLEPSALCEGPPPLLMTANMSLKVCSVRQPDVVMCHTQFSRLTPMTEVLQRLAVLLRVQAKDLMLFAENEAHAPHRSPIPITGEVTLRDVLHAEWDIRTQLMFFDIVPSRDDLSGALVSCKVAWLPLDCIAPTAHFDLKIKFTMDTLIAEVLQNAITENQLLDHRSYSVFEKAKALDRVRLVEISTQQCEVVYVFSHRSPAMVLMHHCIAPSRHLTLRVEEVRPDDVPLPLAVLRHSHPLGPNVQRIMQLISVKVDAAYQCTPHSHPLLIPVRPQDTFEALRQRVFRRARHETMTTTYRGAIIVMIERRAMSLTQIDSENVLEALRKAYLMAEVEGRLPASVALGLMCLDVRAPNSFKRVK